MWDDYGASIKGLVMHNTYWGKMARRGFQLLTLTTFLSSIKTEVQCEGTCMYVCNDSGRGYCTCIPFEYFPNILLLEEVIQNSTRYRLLHST